MPFGKKLKHLKNLGGWATFNSKKRKHEHLEEQENESTRHSPKKARQEPTNPNPERVLRDIPMPAPVEVSMLFEVPTLHEKSRSGSDVMDSESPGNHAECETEAPLGGETANDEAGNAAMATDDNAAGLAAGNQLENETLAVDTGGDDDDEKQEQIEFHYEKIGVHRFVPTVAEAEAAFEDIKNILKPPRKKGPGSVHHGLDEFTHSRIEAMRKFLWKYVAGNSTARWVTASLETARDHERGPHHARMLREWTHAFIANRENLPKNIYGTWNVSMLDNEDLAQAIHLHLQSLGPWIRAQDVVDFVKRPETLVQFGLKKSISLATAHRWMKRLGYRWTTNPSGQYVDGHERKDVVDYRQKTFLPIWMSIEARTRKWTDDQKDELIGEQPANLRVVVWFHDESTFYANDRRKLRWVHKSETAVPRPKGEGASLMVSDFVSADYGWLRSPDKTKEARVFFKAGKNREGYFTNDDILNQTTTAMDILTEFYPDEEHILVYDNATTHTKRSDTALSARHMPKGTKPVGEFWGATILVLDSDGQQVYQRDKDGKLTRKPEKMKVHMDNARFADGSPQGLYFPDDHVTSPGCFKGMAVLLQERGLVRESKLRYECVGFKCEAGATSCCCRRALYSQPDFVAVESLLEAHCHARGFRVLLLPKFHCELNFIEQCWGYAKRKYREFPPSSKEADLQTNLLTSLEMVSIQSMRRYSYRAQRFMNLYHEGLSGKDAAWACKKYKGHRVIPQALLASFDKPNALLT